MKFQNSGLPLKTNNIPTATCEFSDFGFPMKESKFWTIIEFQNFALPFLWCKKNKNLKVISCWLVSEFARLHFLTPGANFSIFQYLFRKTLWTTNIVKLICVRLVSNFVFFSTSTFCKFIIFRFSNIERQITTLQELRCVRNWNCAIQLINLKIFTFLPVYQNICASLCFNV